MNAPSVLERLSTALAERYVLEREIGQGGMATVFLARDLRHERRVAIKVLHPELSAMLGPDRFLSEIKLTASLQHPHILPLFDSGVADGLLYYVMPFVEGETLRARLDRERQLPVADAVRLAREIADALHYAHERGVVHRDVKPENVLLQSGRAVVADFGIALAVQQAGGTRMTQTGLSLGTPHYMAPEQAMGERNVDARADVYALGAMTYEMLAGEPPFTGPTAQAIVARVMTERPRALRIVRGTVPEYVDAAVNTALEKLPADRFATAALYSAALEASNATLARSGARSAATAPAHGLGARAALIGVAALMVGGALGAFAMSKRAPASASTAALALDLLRAAVCDFAGRTLAGPAGNAATLGRRYAACAKQLFVVSARPYRVEHAQTPGHRRRDCDLLLAHERRDRFRARTTALSAGALRRGGSACR
jgi:serine/threonine-protein kinase